MKEIANNPPPFEFSERFRELEKESSSFKRVIEINAFLETLSSFEEDVLEIKDTLKSQSNRQR